MSNAIDLNRILNELEAAGREISPTEGNLDTLVPVVATFFPEATESGSQNVSDATTIGELPIEACLINGDGLEKSELGFEELETPIVVEDNPVVNPVVSEVTIDQDNPVEVSESEVDAWLQTLGATDESVSTEEVPANLVSSTETADTTTTEEPIAATTSEVATTMPVEITPIVTSSIETGTNERALALLRLIQELRETSDTVAATAEA
jgi:hypothetical protein